MKNIVLIFAFATLSFYSCADLEEQMIDDIAVKDYFENEEDVELAIRGLYMNLTDRCLLEIPVILDALTDEYDVSLSNVRPYRYELNQYTFSPSDIMAGNAEGGHWYGLYKSIQSIEIFLDEVVVTENIEEVTFNQYIAEARFIRAFNYFNIVRVHGDVPFWNKRWDDPAEARTIKRTSAEFIYSKILEDLEFAREYLPLSAPTKARATMAAAYALSAKVHLTLATYVNVYTGAYDYRTIDADAIANLTGAFSSHWEAAAEYALELINNSSTYGLRLIEDYQNLFNGWIGDTEEHIFSIDYDGNLEGGGINLSDFENWRNNNNATGAFRKPNEVGGWGAIGTTLEMFNFFDDNDYRKSVSFDDTLIKTAEPPQYIDGKMVADTEAVFHYSEIADYPFPYSAKWTRYPGICDGWPDGQRDSYNIPVFRLGEMYLIAAEALNEMGRTDEALILINQLRARARKGGPSPNDDSAVPVDLALSLTQQEAYHAIWDEWIYEMSFEAKRWYNLVRRDSLVSVMERFVPYKTGVPTNIQEFHKLLPIPQFEMELTDGLVQNKGYN